ncbi:dynein axonemal heavy chain 14 isoform X4 [Struthio camelus]
MLNGRYIMGEPPDSSKKDNSELSSSVEKKYSILRTAVYRGSTERKHKTVIKEVSRKHKEERGESLCQPTGVSEHETMNLNGSITQMVSLMSQNENLKTTLSTTSVSKGGNISTEMQTAVLEPSCSKKICEQPKAERSSNKPLRKRVPSYDRTEPIDDDVIMHILRLRGKLGWETKLPSGERLAGEADVTRHQKFAFMFSAEHKLGEIEMIPVPQWLRERQLYYKLISFNLFSNFRMKKYFSVWKINVKRSKANKSESI